MLDLRNNKYFIIFMKIFQRKYENIFINSMV